MFARKSKQWFDELIYVLLFMFRFLSVKCLPPQQHKELTVHVSHHGGIVHGQPGDGEKVGLSLSCFLPP